MIVKESVFLELSVLSLISGLCIYMLFPSYWVYGTILLLLGVICLWFAFKKRSKFDILWKNLGLYKGSAYPFLKKHEKNGLHDVYFFHLPAGLSVSDFQKHQSAISEYLGHDINISYCERATFSIEV